MRLSLLGLLLLLGVALVVVAPPSRGVDEGEPVTREFTFSADPEVAVLTITHIGGLSGDRTVYTLYGAGRLRLEQRSRSDEVHKSSETMLSYDEMRDFLAIAVEHELLDTSPEGLLAEITHPPTIRDAGTMVVEIHVTSYTRNGENLGAASNTLRLTAPRAQYARHLESTPIGGMAALSDQLSRYRDRLGIRGAR